MTQQTATQTAPTRQEPIRVGDKFADCGGNVWEVIETRPGGHLSLFDKKRTRFQDRYHREVKTWTRVTGA